MKSLYESILDDQDEVMDRMTNQSKEHILKSVEKFINSRYWYSSHPRGDLKYKFGMDNEGVYMETVGHFEVRTSLGYIMHSMKDLFTEKREAFNKFYANKKGSYFCPEFRWKSHKDSINLLNIPTLECIPENIDVLFSEASPVNGGLDISDHKIGKLYINTNQESNLIIKGNSKTKVDTIEIIRRLLDPSKNPTAHKLEDFKDPTFKGFRCKNIKRIPLIDASGNAWLDTLSDEEKKKLALSAGQCI